MTSCISEGKQNQHTPQNQIKVLTDILLDNTGDHRSIIGDAMYLDLQTNMQNEEYI